MRATCGATSAPLELDVTLIHPESFGIPPLSEASSCTFPVVPDEPEVYDTVTVDCAPDASVTDAGAPEQALSAPEQVIVRLNVPLAPPVFLTTKFCERGDEGGDVTLLSFGVTTGVACTTVTFTVPVRTTLPLAVTVIVPDPAVDVAVNESVKLPE
jgi:hypothetical protein